MHDAQVKHISWVGALVATLWLQITTAYLTRLLPTIAPALSDQFGWPDGFVGYASGLTMAGSIVFLLGCGPLIRRLGSIRTLQLGLATSGIGLLAFLFPSWSFVALASLLIGLGYGPSVPAGNDVLHRYAPPQHRALIFSIKQAGVPVGGVIAGLVLPGLIERFGWHASLAFSAALVVITLIAVQPLQRSIDSVREHDQPIDLRTLLSPSNFIAPLLILRGAPNLIRIGLAGAGLAAAQGAWLAFIVTYAVSSLRLTLAAAGVLFAVMQATGIVGRLVLGVISDRLGSGIGALALVAALCGFSSLSLILASGSWPLWVLMLIVGFAGFSVTSWNGVHLSEVARLAPHGQIASASAGATVMAFVGFVAGPLLAAALVGLTQRYEFGFVFAGLVSIAALWPLMGLRRSLRERAFGGGR